MNCSICGREVSTNKIDVYDDFDESQEKYDICTRCWLIIGQIADNVVRFKSKRVHETLVNLELRVIELEKTSIKY